MSTVRLWAVSPFLRLRMALRAMYLRALLRSVEADILHYQIEAHFLPQQEAEARQRKDELNVQLIDCELSVRNN
jgi:hypothetical protein